jgi:CDP-diacylglycerol--glycerol-3-phosphate 3-phosphatidyltransferase
MLVETKQKLRRPMLPVARGLSGLGITPDALTVAGLLIALLAGAALALGHPLVALIGLLLSGLCDLLDGDIARLRPDRDRRFGAFLDSTADRIGEIAIFSGLLLHRVHLGAPSRLWALSWVLALTGGLLVSYTRARAEGLGITCRIGLADRSVRLVLILAMLIAGLQRSGPFLALLAVLSWITVLQRTVHVRRAARGLTD